MMSLAIEIPLSNIEEHFSELGQIGNLGPFRSDGFLRAAWSYEESEAMGYIRSVGVSHGLSAEFDGVGNLFLTTPGRSRQVVQVGSHLDTVPKGGLYDGGAGIVAGLEAILALRPAWPSHVHSLQLVVWRGEESATFGAVCKGSQAAFGKNAPNILIKQFEGRTLEEAILSQGFDPSYISERRPTLSAQAVDAILAHFELHIEQASNLQSGGKDIGIVSSIRGAARLRVVVTGEAAHAGGTPMGASYRRDANLAMATMQIELDQLAWEYLGRGEDLVQTVGVINADLDYNMHDPRVYENAYTKVSPFGYFTLDIRSSRQSTLQSYHEESRKLLEEIASRLRVGVEMSDMNYLPPTETLDRGLQNLVEDCCGDLGLRYEIMPSGALHDVAVVAGQRRRDGSPVPAGLIFIPCLDGISHNPKEYASPESIQAGARVLAEALNRLATGEWGEKRHA